MCFFHVREMNYLYSVKSILVRHGYLTTISSLKITAENFNEHIRMHWGVENKLHWTLDMTFNEDRQRKRNKMAAQNFSFVNKIALNILKKDKSKGSLKSKSWMG